MTTKGDTFENDWLKLIFNAVSIADICTTTGATNLSVALHTASPGETGSQLTSEAAYNGYARVNVIRTSAGWTVTGGSVSPANPITFPTAIAGGTLAPITHFSVGTGVANKLLYYGPVAPTITMAVGVTPQLTTASFITED